MEGRVERSRTCFSRDRCADRSSTIDFHPPGQARREGGVLVRSLNILRGGKLGRKSRFGSGGGVLGLIGSPSDFGCLDKPISHIYSSVISVNVPHWSGIGRVVCAEGWVFGDLMVLFRALRYSYKFTAQFPSKCFLKVQRQRCRERERRVQHAILCSTKLRELQFCVVGF